MGDWLDHYGESIYGTRGGPFARAAWGGATYNGDTIYLHILNSESGVIALPPINAKILSSRVLTGGTAAIKQTGDSLEISVPKTDLQEIDTIVALKLDSPAKEVKVQQ
jgi:alpha-L-fucosidase